MFTGIVEEMGVVQSVSHGPSSRTLTIQACLVLEDLQRGDSLAVDGVCLTLTRRSPDECTVDVTPETLKTTTLGALKVGDAVNLERAMRLTDRVAGHLVQGHVDGTGRVVERREDEQGLVLVIEAQPEILRYCVKRGSLAVDGVSLTTVDVGEQTVIVSIIPYTTKVTTLGQKSVGTVVNLECDLLVKTIARLLQRDESSSARSHASTLYDDAD